MKGEDTMPRGVKGSGKATISKKKAPNQLVEQVELTKQPEQPRQPEQSATKERKPYPSHAERLIAVDKSIERLTNLNTARVSLIEKTEQTLAERKAALVKSEAALESTKALKERIITAINQPPKPPVAKLSPEERTERHKEALAKAREAKRAEKEKYDALIAALQESGKSVDDLLEELKK